MRLGKQLLSHILAAGLLTTAAFAGGKEDPHDLLTKAFQQANIWTQGPVKLDAKVRMPGPNGQDLTLEYTVSWAGPDKWRAEWSAPGLQQVTVLNNNKLSYVTNQPSPLLRALQFEGAIGGLDGGNPAGPYAFPPLDYLKAKIDVTKKKVGAVDEKCLAWGSQPVVTYCIDAATGHLLSADTEFGTFEYSDYATSGSASYPKTVKVSYAKTLMEEGTVTITRDDKLADALFTAPEKSTTVDFHSCADVDKNFTAPHLTKLIPAKMPDAAKKAKKYGMVWVLVTVGKDGSVEKQEVIGGDPDLNPAAKEAVQQYKYTPYMRCGEAVEFEKVVVVPFAPPAPIPNSPLAS
jgi:TonB family protein